MSSNNQPKEKKVDLEEPLAHMMMSLTASMNETKANFQNQAQQLQNQLTQLQNQGAQLKNLEVQMGQMLTMLSERPQGTLPSTSEVNPRRGDYPEKWKGSSCTRTPNSDSNKTKTVRLG